MLGIKQQLLVGLSIALIVLGLIAGRGEVVRFPAVALTSTSQPQPTLPILTVCPEGPPSCQFRKIQDAINAAPEPQGPFFSPTAEIRVAPGTYEENLLIIFKVVELKGAGKDRVFLSFPKGGRETQFGILIVAMAGALIEGFTIQGVIAIVGLGAGAHIRGNNLMGGVFINASVYSAPIEDNVFLKDPQATQCAGIAAINVGRLQILRNTFDRGCDIQIEQARLNIPSGVPFRAPGERVLIEGNQGADEIWIKDGAAIAIHQNTVRHIRLAKVEATLLEGNVVRRGVTIGSIQSGIWVEGSSDVVIQKNIVEENQHGITITSDPFRIPTRGASVAVISNRVVRNGWGIVTESLEYVTVCQGNEVTENKEGDYGVGRWWSDPQPSPELKQKCEGG